MICAESMGAFLGLECSRRKLRVFSQNFINVKGLIPEIDLLIKFIVSAFHVLSIYDYQHQTYIFQCFIKNYYRIQYFSEAFFFVCYHTLNNCEHIDRIFKVKDQNIKNSMLFLIKISIRLFCVNVDSLEAFIVVNFKIMQKISIIFCNLDITQYHSITIFIKLNKFKSSSLSIKDLHSNMKSAIVKQIQPAKPHVDPRQIHQLYRLSHSQLQLTLKRLKQKLIQEIDQFSSKLIGALNHLNYFRYMRAFPQDDIKFVFRQKNNASLSETRFDQKENIMHRMANFQIMRVDYAGISDNCIYEIEKLITDNPNILNFKQYCPSGNTFINQNKQNIDALLPYWEQQVGPMDLTGIFKEVSEHFPKEQIKNLGQIFSQADLKVSGARLIFRASQHNFQSASFKDHCVGRAPTLLLVKSEKGFIFGGYTPCKWLKTKQQQFVSDPNAKSFLFSLNKRMIFPIKPSQKNYAISAYGGWGPIFGSPYGPDLSIADKCHINQHSCSSLGSHYDIPPSIKQYSNEAYSLLAGGKNFKTVQYQLYELDVE